ncbi:MAG: zinc ribbon domain-containing protein, partial [Bacilli bacterium]|nr:zinc ribbon domain-containing protein [Bacilli bacterium]
MFFLIGVIILIVFVLILLFYFKIKINSFFQHLNFPFQSVPDLIREARFDDQDVPKSLSSMDSIYLSQIQNDFVDINIEELKRKAEDILLRSYFAFEKKDSGMVDGKIKSFVDQMIEDYKNQDVHFKDIVIHKTVISNYKKDKGTASIFFSSSYQYIKVVNGIEKKVQDRAKLQFLYIYDENNVPVTFSISCPNCGSPIKSLGEKKCSYCGSLVKE